MKFIELFGLADSFFKEAWELYETSFPLEERRTLSGQRDILNIPEYHFQVILIENKILGILLWWEFNDLIFIEHFATMPGMRGQGYGKNILQQFLDKGSRPVILEVELPEDALKHGRIEFYERSGFKLNTHFYMQPPIRKGCSAIQLYIMSYRYAFSEESVAHFVDNYHPLIYGRE